MDTILMLQHGSFAEMAEALRTRADRITTDWVSTIRGVMPHMDQFTVEQLQDTLPRILPAIADALASSDPGEIRGLLEHAPKQGLARLSQQQDVSQVMHEDRLLRAIIVLQVEEELGRQMNVAESAALHSTIDIMLQQSVVALVDEQQARLRAAAETELKFLSFLAHDLNNNLNAVTLSLHALRRELGDLATHTKAVDWINYAMQAITDTTRGMKQLLEHERLRKSTEGPTFAEVNLRGLVSAMVERFSAQAQQKNITLQVEVPPDAKAITSPELVNIALQNVLSNAIKYSMSGTVRVGCEQRGSGNTARQVLKISDQGPGISPELRQRLFQAFRRGEAHGQEGVGLGLAIVSQAARLLDAEVAIDSRVGQGTTLYLALPVNPKGQPQNPFQHAFA